MREDNLQDRKQLRVIQLKGKKLFGGFFSNNGRAHYYRSPRENEAMQRIFHIVKKHENLF